MNKECKNLKKINENNNNRIDLELKAHRVGHKGIFKMYNKVKREYYWNNRILNGKYIVSTCFRCEIFKSQRTNNQTEDIPIKLGLLFMKIGLDIVVVPLPRSTKGNLYIIVYYLTKWVKLKLQIKLNQTMLYSFFLRPLLVTDS